MSAVDTAKAPSRGAQDLSPDLAQQAASIARQTMSPFCPGRTLSDCPSEYASDWRRDIRQMLKEGKSAAEIQRELESRTGNNLSGSPRRDVSYAVPVGMALLFGSFLFIIFRRLRAARPQSESLKSGEVAPSVDEDRLLQELGRESEEDD